MFLVVDNGAGAPDPVDLVSDVFIGVDCSFGPFLGLLPHRSWQHQCEPIATSVLVAPGYLGANSAQQSVKAAEEVANTSQSALTLHRVAAFCLPRLRLLKIALVLVRLDHVASGIVNANHSVL